MEYQVSARKYRPATFSSVVGQEALTTTLRNAVKSGKLAHAFLFCGPRGVGKTTCARIFAKTINCENPTAESEACGECESCKAFAEQRSYNIFELDAASNNSVENIKQLMEQTRIPPQVGRYKVFIIDEVHMLSTQAFNAFLKTLEEPPSYVIFILATTEKNKLLPTILSRCQIYDFERMSVPATVAHLKMVAEREGYTYEEAALEIIAEKADGGMRDALSIFDQVASFCQGDITLEKVIKDLNLMDIEHYFQLTDLSLQGKCADVMLLLDNMLEQGMDAGHIVSGFAEHIRNVMMAKDQQTITLLEASAKYAQRYADQAQRCPASFLYKALQILTRCDLNYRQSSNKRLLVEITLIEVAQITQPADADGVPRKGRRLKNLFKKLAPLQPKTTEQAVVADDKAEQKAKNKENGVQRTENREQSTENRVQRTEAAVVDAGKPDVGKTVINTNGVAASVFGNTFKTLGSVASKSAESDGVAENVGEESKRFGLEELNYEWLAMCNSMSKNLPMRGLAASMRNCKLEIPEYPKVEIIVSNNILLEQIQTIQNRVRATLSQNLHNSEITLAIRLAENHEVKKVMSKFELYEKLYTEIPSLKKLVHSLGLELVGEI